MHEKWCLCNPQTIRKKGFSHWTSTVLKLWVENAVSAIQHTGNKKRFFEVVPQLIKLILLQTIVALHNTKHVQMACLIKGGMLSQCLKQIIIKAH